MQRSTFTPKHSHFLRVLIAFIFATSSSAHGTPDGIHFSGQIVSSDGNISLNSSSVDFKIKVLSPLGCVLYSESHNGVNLATTQGAFSLVLGKGTASYNAYDSSTPQSSDSLRKVFDNKVNSVSSLSGASTSDCTSGTYTPSATDVRQVRIEFDAHNGDGPQIIYPYHTVRNVPYALLAQEADNANKLGGKPASDYLETSQLAASETDPTVQAFAKGSLPTCAVNEVLKSDGTNFSCVSDQTGGSPALATTSSTGVVQVGGGLAVDGSGVLSVDYTTVKSNLSYSIGDLKTGLGASQFPDATCSADKTLTWSSVTDTFSCTAISITSAAVSDFSTAVDARISADSNLVRNPVAADVDVNQKNLTNTGYITMYSGKSLHLSNNTSDPAGLVAADKGKMWYRSDLNEVRYWNGTAAVTLGAAGAGLQSLNGLTDNTQTFAVDGAGTDVAINSASGTHTFSIPSASATNRGVLTSADWTTFNNKLGTSSSFSGDVSGNYNSLSVDKIKGTAVSATAPTSGQLLVYDGTSQYAPVSISGDASLSTSGTVTVNNIRVDRISSAAGQYFSYMPNNVACANNEVLKWNGTGWICGTDNSGAGSVTGVTASSPLASSGGAAPDISLANGTALGQTLRWDGSNWIAAQLSNADVTGLGTLATKNSVDLGTAEATGTLDPARLPALTGDVTSSAGSAATTLSNTGVTAGTYSKLTVDAKGRVTSATDIGSADVTTALGFTPLNRAGDVMTGPLGLSGVTSDPAGLVAGDKGKMWYRTDTNEVKYWNGTAAIALGASGAGLQSLNGLTDNAQTFAVGSSGTAPAWNSASGIHTLDIPNASGAGVTAGLISKADYDTFVGKQNAGNYITDLTGDITASGPGSTAATIANNAINSAKIADGSIVGADLNFTGSNGATSSLMVVDATGKFYNFACGSNGDVATWTASGWSCQAPSPLLPSLADGKIWIGDGSNAAIAQTLSGDASISNTGVVTVNNIRVDRISSEAGQYFSYMPNNVACANNEVLKWNGTGWVCGTDNAGAGTVTGVTASAPLASSGGAAPDISLANGTASGQTLRWNGTNWVAAQLSNSDVTGLGSLATKNSVDLGSADATGTLDAARLPALTGDVTSSAGSAATTLANSGVTAGTYSKVTVDAKGRVTVGANIDSTDVTTALGFTPLNKAGDMMTGPLGLSGVTSDPAGLVAGDKGKMWYRTDTNEVKYWNGTAAIALGASGAGLQSLNGLTDNAQTFALNGTGSDVAINSASGVHTISIPSASATNRGVLTSADWSTFNNKLGTSSSFSGDVSGNYNSMSVDKIKGTAVSATAPTSGQMLVYDGTTQYSPVSISGDATMSNAGALTLANSGVTAGTYSKVTVDAKGRVTTGASLSASDIPALDWAKITSGLPTTLSGYGITDAVTNIGGTPSIQTGTFAARPAFGTAGRLYIASDNNTLYRDTGAAWVAIGDGTGAGGTVSSVTSANTDIAVATTTTTPVLTLNSGTTGGAGDADKIAKLDGSGLLASGMIPSLDAAKITTGTLPIARGGTNSTTALNNNRMMISNGGAIVESAAITANRALVSDANGIPTHSAVTDTELGYLAGTTSSLQTQLNGMAQLAGRAGGQNLRGGTAASENLTLDSTSHATKGNVLINPSGGKVGIGTSSPSATLGISKTDTFIGVNKGLEVSNVNNNDLGSLVQELSGGIIGAENYATGSYGKLTGVTGWAYNSANATVNSVIGASGETEVDDGTISQVMGTQSMNSIYGGTISSLYGTYIDNINSGGTITNRYGLYYSSSGSATNDFGIYINGGTKNYINGNLGIGTTTPATKLDVNGAVRVGADASACAAGIAGAIRYNGGNVEYCNGSAWNAFSAGSAGITSLNGLTGATQTFATPGTSGTNPNWSSSGTAHTLNIPMASAAGVNAGLISKTDYDAFSAKLGIGTSFSGDVSGNYNSTSVDKIKGTAVTITSLTDKNYLKYNGTAWVNSMIDAATDLSGILPVANGGTGANSLASGNLLIGGGTGAVTTLAAGGAGNIVYGTGLSSWASGTADTAGLVDKSSTQTISGAKAFTNYVQMSQQNAVRFADSDSTNYVAIRAPATVATDVTLTLPDTAGSNGQVLTTNGSGVLSWTTASGGGSALSAITAATATNSVDNTNYAQTWNWSTATTQLPMTMSANSLTTGSLLNLTTSSNSLSSTNGILYVANTGTSTSGTVAKIQSNSTAGSGLTVLASGNIGIGTATPSANLEIADVGNNTGLLATATSGNAVETHATSGNAIFAFATTGTAVYSNVNGDNGTGIYSIVSGDGGSAIYGIASGPNSSAVAATVLDPSSIAASFTHADPNGYAVYVNGGQSYFAGKVGIGTTSPGAPLDVKGAIRMSGSTSGYTGFQPAAAAGSTVWTLPTADGTNGQVLSTNGSGVLSWSTPAAGGGALSSLTAATTTNSIDNLLNAQTWAWSTATTQSPMTITANALTTGSLLNLTTSNNTLNSSNGLLYVANTGSSTTGKVARIQANSTAGSGLTVLSSGTVGIGTDTPSTELQVVGTVTTDALDIQNDSGVTWGNGNTGIFGNSSSDYLALWLNGGQLLTLANGAKVGIGVDNPQSKLDVLGGVSIGSYASSTAAPANGLIVSGNVGIGTSSPGAALDVKGAIRMSGSTSGYTGFQPAAAAGSTVWTLPTADGTNGQVLSTNGSGVLSWTTAGGGGSALSGLTAATATNTINNANYQQVWNWGTGTTQYLMNLNADAITTGTLLNVSTSSGSFNSTDGLFLVANNTGSTNGIVARIQSNNSAGSGLTVKANGDVGIGTTSPSSKLHVAAGDMLVDNDQAFYFGSSLNTGIMGKADGASDYLTFKTDGSVRMRINYAGNTFIGGNGTPTARLEVMGSTTDNTAAALNVTDSASSSKLYIRNDGNVGVGTTSPGAKLDVKGAIRMSGSTSGYTGFQPAAAAGSTVWTLPTADGTNGQVLSTNGSGVLSWVTASGGGGALSGLTAASATNSIDNTNYAQTWNWSTATTQSPMTMTANALTTGSILSLTSSSTANTGTNGLLYVANTSATTTGTVARIQSNSTAGSGMTVLGNGNVGIGTTSPSQALQVAGNIKASGQLATGSQTITSGATSTINWNNGNSISTNYNCATSLTMDNMQDGGTYTLVITDTGTTQCDFATTTTGTGAGTVTYRFKPANATRTASSHTVYTLSRVGSVVYVSWSSGF